MSGAPDTRHADSWLHLRGHTQARIALGRSGGSQRTRTVLDFRIAHAAARDAVHAPFDGEMLARGLAHSGFEAQMLRTCVRSRADYLLRPDLGRAIDEESSQLLVRLREECGPRDLAIVVSDGLSALAAQRQVPELLRHLLPMLSSQGMSHFPIFVAPFGRVKLQDPVGEILGAKMSLMLLGERPGLGTPDSLGAYLTWLPGAARTDADRNCVSNIRPDGFPPHKAAESISRLLVESRRLSCSGVALKV